jgi:tripartite-type tricarboxylate transporter receptor subunit TctC
MKENPGKATLVNQLASAQMTDQLLRHLTGTSLQLIPYRGAGPAMTDLLAVQVDLMVSQAAVVLPNLHAGTIKPIANLSPRRSQAVPEIPSSDESGVPGLYASGWFGFFAPKGTPKDAKLNDAMVLVLNELAVRADSPGLDWILLQLSSSDLRGLRPCTRPRSRNGGWAPRYGVG